MADQPKQPDPKASQERSELFAGRVPGKVQSDDLFAGRIPMSRRGSEEGDSVETSVSSRRSAGRGSKSGSSFWIYLLLSMNLLLMGGMICFLVMNKTPQPVLAVPNPSQPTAVPAASSSPEPASAETPAADRGDRDVSDLLGQISLDQTTSDVLKESASLAAAAKLYESGQYENACFMYGQLQKNLYGHSRPEQCLRDYLYLQMALCLQKAQDQELMSDLFTKALQSPFPVIRGLANYNLAFLELHNQHYLSARQHAYQALAAFKIFESKMPLKMEADCYYLASESLVRQILSLTDQSDELPGQSWSDSTPILGVPADAQDRLQEFLMMGVDAIGAAAVAPIVSRDPQRETGTQWDAICQDAPLEEILWKYSAAAETNVEWIDIDPSTRRRPVSLYLPNSAGAWLAEVAAGSTGLLWRYDGDKARIYNPAQYTDFDAHKAILIQEGIAAWQRFLLKYRGDERMPNAHYMLGLLYAMEQQSATALGEYKLLASQYANDALAPFALLNSSKIKTNLLDFDGARADLQELLVQYPECKVIDEASLYLAEAAAGSGDYDQAERMFRKVYQINLTEAIRRRAAYGLGRCAFERKDYASTTEWLSRAVEMTHDPRDRRLAPSCFILGQAFIELEQYARASVALRMALKGEPPIDEYVQIVLELVRAESRQEHYVQALEMLESIPEQSLDQEQSCEVLLGRARVLQTIDLSESAISLLRRRIEYIAEASIRARLTLELANCYAAVGDYRIAEKELRDTVYDLEDPLDRQQAFCLLGEVTYAQDQVDRAREICEATLREYPQASSYRQRLVELLGTIHEQRNDYAAAAMVYAGLVPGAGAEQP